MPSWALKALKDLETPPHRHHSAFATPSSLLLFKKKKRGSNASSGYCSGGCTATDDSRQGRSSTTHALSTILTEKHGRYRNHNQNGPFFHLEYHHHLFIRIPSKQKIDISVSWISDIRTILIASFTIAFILFDYGSDDLVSDVSSFRLWIRRCG